MKKLVETSFLECYNDYQVDITAKDLVRIAEQINAIQLKGNKSE